MSVRSHEEIDKQCNKYGFKVIGNNKSGQKLRKIDKSLSYMTVRGHVLDLLANIDKIPRNLDFIACDQVVLQ